MSVTSRFHTPSPAPAAAVVGRAGCVPATTTGRQRPALRLPALAATDRASNPRPGRLPMSSRSGVECDGSGAINLDAGDGVSLSTDRHVPCPGCPRCRPLCELCGGSGEYAVLDPDFPTNCPRCHGTGIEPKPCGACGGSGYVLDPKPGDPLSGGDSKTCPRCDDGTGIEPAPRETPDE
jgi:DnaJ-class molecular chaperone